jgi:predicted DNA-binding transcriptional regulator AlpA
MQMTEQIEFNFAKRLDDLTQKIDALGNTGKLLGTEEVTDRCGLTRQQIHKMVQRGEFPSPVQIAGRRRAWREADYIAWVNSRPVLRTNTG